MKIHNIQMFFLILYMFFISFFNFTPFYIISAIMLILFTGLNILKSKKIKLSVYIKYEIFFILYNLLYVFFDITVSKEVTLSTLKTVCVNIAINFAITNTINDFSDIKKVIKAFVPNATFACIFIILYTGGNGDDGRIAHGYPRLFSDTNYTSMEVASWALYAAAIALLMFKKTKQKKWLIPYPLFIILIVWSGSRKCLLLACLIQVIIYIAFDDKINFRKLVPKLMFVLILAVIGIISIFRVQILYEKVGYRIVGFLDGTEGAAVARKTNAIAAQEYITEKPFFGYGLGTFSYINNSPSWTENNYLELSVGGGIVLTVTYYLLMICILYNLYKKQKNNIYTKLLMYIIAFICVFDIMTVSYLGRLESLFVTLSAIIVNLNKKEKINGE